jgi:hypothetical protein
MKTIIDQFQEMKYILNQIAIDRELLNQIDTPSILYNKIIRNQELLVLIYAKANNDNEFINKFNKKEVFQSEINRRYVNTSKSLKKIFNLNFDAKLIELM